MAIEEEGYRFYGYGNLCKKCGKLMKPIEENELQDFGFGEKKRRKQTSFTCPKCGECLQVMKTGLWD